jgi:hypothetical protein
MLRPTAFKLNCSRGWDTSSDKLKDKAGRKTIFENKFANASHKKKPSHFYKDGFRDFYKF